MAVLICEAVRAMAFLARSIHDFFGRGGSLLFHGGGGPCPISLCSSETRNFREVVGDCTTFSAAFPARASALSSRRGPFAQVISAVWYCWGRQVTML
jgi:hypothetical protein